ncbi:hypothetical protein CDAR_448981 [Caerostris darwini]|uniref:Uncharacterized protein n=1 Tax=Caerostris darwini TaxID=1538125 RepID=A0AAV4WCE1_9ARAC|nr:hypothetical protein CDAR_448981 [Caerostris darwini]
MKFLDNSWFSETTSGVGGNIQLGLKRQQHAALSRIARARSASKRLPWGQTIRNSFSISLIFSTPAPPFQIVAGKDRLRANSFPGPIS